MELLPEEHQQQLRGVFQQYAGRDGTLDQQKFKTAYCQLCGVDESEVRYVVQLPPEFDDFSDENLRLMVEALDRDQDGKITLEDFYRGFQQYAQLLAEDDGTQESLSGPESLCASEKDLPTPRTEPPSLQSVPPPLVSIPSSSPRTPTRRRVPSKSPRGSSSTPSRPPSLVRADSCVGELVRMYRSPRETSSIQASPGFPSLEEAWCNTASQQEIINHLKRQVRRLFPALEKDGYISITDIREVLAKLAKQGTPVGHGTPLSTNQMSHGESGKTSTPIRRAKSIEDLDLSNLLSPSKDESRIILNELDQNNDGLVSRSEFEDMLTVR